MWHQVHQDLLERFHAKFGLPSLNNDDARAWTKRLAEQFAFTFTTQGWGTKRADPGRPPSTDCICTRNPFLGYDVIISQGAPHQRLAAFNEIHAIDLTGQVYIGVMATNHLGTAPTQPPTQPPHVCPPPPPLPGYEAIGGDPFFWTTVGVPLEADYTEAQQALNAGSSVWFSRTCHSLIAAFYGNPSPDTAPIVKKHRNEWRAALGLAPLP